MLKMLCDLHTHTNFSDGVLTPIQLIDKSSAFGLSTIAITDHDSTLAFTEAHQYGLKNNIDVISGVELSASVGDYEAHILGYFINPNDKYLLQTLDDFRHARKTRAFKIVEKLNNLGAKINIDDLLPNENETKSVGAIGRAHIARKLVASGFVKNFSDAFRDYIGNDGPAFVPKPHFTIHETVELIANAGGVSFLAHPGRNIEEITLHTIVKSGIDGIEVYHPSHKKYVERFYHSLAKEKNMLISGGSDFHGGGNHEEENLGKFGVSIPQLNKIKMLAETRKK